MGQRVSCGSHQKDHLFVAVREGDLPYVEKVACEEPKLLHKPRFHERLTPLHVAASHGQTEVRSALLFCCRMSFKGSGCACIAILRRSFAVHFALFERCLR